MILDDSCNFARQFFECWYKNRVHLLSKENVVMLSTVRKCYNLRLELKKRFYESSAEIIAKKLHVFLVFGGVAIFV